MVRVLKTIDRAGQFLITPGITLEGWWAELAIAPEDVIELYRQHATSEQFHSEFKADLDLERLPSGKFATNALVMTLGGFAYNILRFVGQAGLIALDRHRRGDLSGRITDSGFISNQTLIFLFGSIRSFNLYNFVPTSCWVSSLNPIYAAGLSQKMIQIIQTCSYAI